jgi:hypothetical protein
MQAYGLIGILMRRGRHTIFGNVASGSSSQVPEAMYAARPAPQEGEQVYVDLVLEGGQVRYSQVVPPAVPGLEQGERRPGPARWFDINSADPGPSSSW